MGSEWRARQGWRESVQWEDPSSMASRDDYIVYDGQRYVKPYFFQFVAHVKQRWSGRPIAQLFASEFRQRPLQYYEEAVRVGRIQVDGHNVTPEYRVRQSQAMTHYVHRHEPAVDATPVEVLHESDTVLVVCKPSSMPVHPCGQYRKNTVLSLLQALHGYGQLFPIHRLDRSVSGLLILAKTAAAAETFRTQMMSGGIHKQYIARVQGSFPALPVEVSAPLLHDASRGFSRVVLSAPLPPQGHQPAAAEPANVEEREGQVQLVDEGRSGEEKDTRGGCERPEEGSRPRGAGGGGTAKARRKKRACERAAREAEAAGGGEGVEQRKEKEAVTRFEREAVAGDGSFSIVRCSPLTGRTHQIRVHLQHVGHPVANDDLYLLPSSPTATPTATVPAPLASIRPLASLPSTNRHPCTEHPAATAVVPAADAPNVDAAAAVDDGDDGGGGWGGERDSGSADLKGSRGGGNGAESRACGSVQQTANGMGGNGSEKEGGQLSEHCGRGEGSGAWDGMGGVGPSSAGERACKIARVQQHVGDGTAPSPGLVHVVAEAAGGVEVGDGQTARAAHGSPSDADAHAHAVADGGTDAAVCSEGTDVRKVVTGEAHAEQGGEGEGREVEQGRGEVAPCSGVIVDVTEKHTRGHAAAAAAAAAATAAAVQSGPGGTSDCTVPSIPGDLTDPLCPHCPFVPAEGVQLERNLWLHCCRYSGPDWSFDCPMPSWAQL